MVVYCIWHTIVNLAQILKYKTFDLACRSQVGGISVYTAFQAVLCYLGRESLTVPKRKLWQSIVKIRGGQVRELGWSCGFLFYRMCCHHLLIMSMVVDYMAYCWPMHFHHSMSPIKHLNETGLLPGMGKLNDFSAIAACACTGVVHNFCSPHGLLLRLMSSDALVHL